MLISCHLLCCDAGRAARLFLRFFGGRSLVWERLLLLLFSGLFPAAVAAFLLSRHCVVFAGICYIFFFLAMGVCRQAAGLGRH